MTRTILATAISFAAAWTGSALAAVTAPPPGLNAPAFYQKYVDADGIPVMSSGLVPDTALFVARDIARVMLAKRADVRARIVQNGGRIAIMAQTEVTTDIPEHANLYTLFPGSDWNVYRGLGGTLFIPMTTGAEENVLGYANDPYKGEGILVHEFAHGIYNLGLTQVDGTFASRLQSAYSAALGAGLWSNTYAAVNVAEYWAEGVQSWFNTNLEAIPTNGIHNAVNTRSELQSYDPALYALVAEAFGAASLPWEAPGTGAADRDADGIPDAVEGPEDTNRFVRDNDVLGNARLFAMQQYRDFLAREGDAGGIGFWANQVVVGAQTRAQVIESFFASPEFQGAIAPVARLYFAYFLRVPDYAGLNFWIGYYKAGNPLESISNAFSASAEFQSRYGALNNSQFVTLVYNNVLGRAPDAPGLAFWKNQLDTGAMTRGQVMVGFSESAEYRDTSDSAIYVTMMYFGMLRRAPDAGGFDFWVQYRDAGNSGQALINGFLSAPEYRSRFLP